MPLNVPGLLAPFQLLLKPRLVLPSLTVKDIRALHFPALHKAGYRGVVFDKDNCLTVPHRDTLVPELEDSWRQCRRTFGAGNVLIVSNSAGTHLDAGEIQAESVTHHLGVPVLRHPSMKPAYSCIKLIRNYFATLPKPIKDDELIVVGDRIFTDVIMANRMRTSHVDGPLAVWTTGVWHKESMLMRWMEKGLVSLVAKYSERQQSTREAAFRELV
ncbi:hypothetical protein HGRIS_001964 [Hohenbuehelia grisea]|uniref:Uncharacterized protein n=1 Tax=Hohenbuehelia grisea TaxID=104357 RepID=A0ABR3JJH2_9AGAR